MLPLVIPCLQHPSELTDGHLTFHKHRPGVFPTQRALAKAEAAVLKGAEGPLAFGYLIPLAALQVSPDGHGHKGPNCTGCGTDFPKP